MDEQIPRYRKKSNKRPPKKFNHKHQYENCVFEYISITFSREKGFYPAIKRCIGSYCTICGNIGKVIDRDWTIDTVHAYPIIWTEKAEDEMNDNTRTLPLFIFDTDLFRVKKVNLEDIK